MRIPATSGPRASISPDRSEPSVRGSGCGSALLPPLIQPSHGPTPAAWTFTRTSPWPGVGTGTSSNRIVSEGPNSCTRQAIIDVPTWRRASSMEMLPIVIGQSFYLSPLDRSHAVIRPRQGQGPLLLWRFLLLVRYGQGIVLGVNDED